MNPPPPVCQALARLETGCVIDRISPQSARLFEASYVVEIRPLVSLGGKKAREKKKIGMGSYVHSTSRRNQLTSPLPRTETPQLVVCDFPRKPIPARGALVGPASWSPIHLFASAGVIPVLSLASPPRHICS